MDQIEDIRRPRCPVDRMKADRSFSVGDAYHVVAPVDVQLARGVMPAIGLPMDAFRRLSSCYISGAAVRTTG